MSTQGRRIRQSRSRKKPNLSNLSNSNTSSYKNKHKNRNNKNKQKQNNNENHNDLDNQIIQSSIKFENHKKEAKESIKKLLNNLDDNDSSSSSDEDDEINSQNRLLHLQKTMKEHYNGDDNFNMDKFTEKLHSTCVICLEKVRNKDSIWQCEQCFCLLHLPCTQNWAKSCFFEDLGSNEKEEYWPCPKCRMLYSIENIPRSYKCFCGKIENPPVDYWIVPHSCGNSCDKPLKPDCGHQCTLRCHPGNCPPCPQTVEVSCYCNNKITVRRCNDRDYSCNSICNKLLACNEHRCESICHKGECSACSKTRKAICQCGAEESLINCSIGDYHCNTVCNKPYKCGFHNCEKICHSGDCGECPLSGSRYCHCGKTKFNNLLCNESTPSCEDTCNKPLGCSRNHKCNQRCHPGDCSKCRIHVVKSCRCGNSKKSVQCYQEFLCNSKCTRLRNCKRHQCKKKCCPGNCPPCNEVCDRRLPCGNHKCQAICHQSNCFPCPVTVDVTCFCKSQVITVPCGAEKKTKPPRCKKDCKIPPTCHHSNRTSHSCHFNQCPPCEQICSVIPINCIHPCPLPCHDPIPAWPTIPKKLKRFDPMKQKSLPISSVKCPPCEMIVKRQCIGLHHQYEVACHTDRLFECKRKCGNPLACGNHVCELTCHLVTQVRDSREILIDENDRIPDNGITNFSKILNITNNKREKTTIPELFKTIDYFKNKYKDTCPPCELGCQKKRKPFCKHPCKLPCHPEDCPPCKILIKKYCHCPLSTRIVLKCFETHIPKEEMDNIRSCGIECTRKIECGHICNLICHPGDCRDYRECKKKVRKYCPCKQLKKVFLCNEKSKIVECEESCIIYKKQQEEKRLQEEKRKKEQRERDLAFNNNNNKKQKKQKKRKQQKTNIKIKKKDNIIIVKIKGIYKTLTSTEFWKILFIYSLPFIILFSFLILAYIKN